MKIFCKFLTVNISKLHFLLVICIAKNFIWTNFILFSQYFDFFAPSDSRFSNSCISAKYCPILTNHTSMGSLFIQLSDDVQILISKNWHLRLVLWSRVTYADLQLKKHYYQCWEQLCCFIFFCGNLNFHQDSWMNRKFKWTAFIWNKNVYCHFW